jgi:ribonuclease HI
LKFLIRKKIKDAIIYYDYQGIEAWITDAWKAKKTVAKSYRENYLKLVEANRLNVIFKKVKSHSGDKYNDMADQLAKAGLNISAKNQ